MTTTEVLITSQALLPRRIKRRMNQRIRRSSRFCSDQRGGYKEQVQAISSPPKERAKSPTLEPPFQTHPFIKSTPELASKRHDRFMMKRSCPSTGIPLNCRDYPFSEDIPRDRRRTVVFLQDSPCLTLSIPCWRGISLKVRLRLVPLRNSFSRKFSKAYESLSALIF